MRCRYSWCPFHNPSGPGWLLPTVLLTEHLWLFIWVLSAPQPGENQRINAPRAVYNQRWMGSWGADTPVSARWHENLWSSCLAACQWNTVFSKGEFLDNALFGLPSLLCFAPQTSGVFPGLASWEKCLCLNPCLIFLMEVRAHSYCRELRADILIFLSFISQHKCNRRAQTWRSILDEWLSELALVMHFAMNTDWFIILNSSQES